MNNLLLILKGFIIGVGKIIPGVSGAVLAISLGIYEKGINAILNIFNKKNFMFLMYLGIGFVISIVTMSNVVIYLMNNVYFWTMLLFVGLIIGGMSDIINEVKDKINIKNVMYMSISTLIVLFLSKNNISINISYNFITIFILGMIESFTMIVPGISGTAIHLMLGSYDFIMNMFSKLIIKDLIPFILGMIAFTLLFIKIISFILKKYKIESYYAIIGFTISSIIYLLTTLINHYKIYEYVVGIILFFIGVKIGNNLVSEK